MNDSEPTLPKPSLRVLEEIAANEGVSPTALEPPLNDVVDPAALNRLFEPTGTGDSARNGNLTFQYHGYDVTIYSNGTVELAE